MCYVGVANRYLDQLGMSATYDTRTYCRQTLIGGNYGLLNTTNFLPNPDYYRSLNNQLLPCKFQFEIRRENYFHNFRVFLRITMRVSLAFVVAVLFFGTG